MSKYSLYPVDNSEALTRFVFSPMHISKNGNLKPSIFSHVHLKGCSVQRESIASLFEISNFINNFLKINNKEEWKGVLMAKCSDLRNISVQGTTNRSVCIYDTAKEKNTSHADIGQSQYILEADEAELRHDILEAFNKGKLFEPNKYRFGSAWRILPTEFLLRKS